MALTLGIDFGTDSVRALVVDSRDGSERGVGVSYYPRWQRGAYCNPSESRFRQHPRDYIDGLTAAVRKAVENLARNERNTIAGIAIDTTGSTPVAVDQTGTPLALHPDFAENPNAMFVLWKDHTAVAEAEEINTLCRSWHTDYTKYSGGIYSSEWFWAKILHLLREDAVVAEAAYSWVEHCDWIPFLLSGGTDVSRMKRSRCAAGHKALWHPEWGGLPSQDFLEALDPRLSGLRERLYTDTHTSDRVAGTLPTGWADTLGLPAGIPITVGAFDAHMGAVGGEIEPFHLSRIMGTSTCDILVIPNDHPAAGKLVRGICGQVDGSVIPGMLGLEAGQSAFGDVYAWFADLLAWPLEHLLAQDESLDPELRNQLIDRTRHAILPELSRAAADLPPDEQLIAVDWLNGRRTPDADQRLTAAVAGISLATDAPRLFRSLVEATCYGARAIVERFVAEGIPIEGVIGLGGVAKKSPFIMQTLADVLGRPIRIAESEQTCALGAAMYAAVGAGIHPDIHTAMRAMGSGFSNTYTPDSKLRITYDRLYQRYRKLGKAVEELVNPHPRPL
jgi:L-ribulokinase